MKTSELTVGTVAYWRPHISDGPSRWRKAIVLGFQEGKGTAYSYSKNRHTKRPGRILVAIQSNVLAENKKGDRIFVEGWHPDDVAPGELRPVDEYETAIEERNREAATRLGNETRNRKRLADLEAKLDAAIAHVGFGGRYSLDGSYPVSALWHDEWSIPTGFSVDDLDGFLTLLLAKLGAKS